MQKYKIQQRTHTRHAFLINPSQNHHSRSIAPWLSSGLWLFKRKLLKVVTLITCFKAIEIGEMYPILITTDIYARNHIVSRRKNNPFVPLPSRIPSFEKRMLSSRSNEARNQATILSQLRDRCTLPSSIIPVAILDDLSSGQTRRITF